MASVETHTSSSYQEFARLLRELHRLMSLGDGDSPEADAIRDEMDGPWYTLSEEEQKRARGMSADLYTLEGNSPIQHPREPGVFEDELAERIREARDREDFDSVLLLLRQNPEKISADRASMLRALSYERLGDVETAILFLQGGVRLSQEPDSYAVFLLIKLLEYGRVQLALEWATRLMSQKPAPSSTLWQMIGNVFFDAAQEGDATDRRRANLEAAAKAYREARSLATRLDVDPHERLLAVNSMLGEALSKHLLGDDEQAVAALDEALTVDPDDETVLTVRGLLKMGGDFAAAKQDFQRAVQAHATSVWPYFYLAYDKLQQGDFHACMQNAAAGIRRTSDPDALAGLYEWMAIALAETGAPPESVLSCFEAAIAVSPENERIARNRTIYQESLGSSQNARPWSSASGLERRIPVHALAQSTQRLGLAPTLS